MHNKKPTLNSWERYRIQRNHTTYLIRDAKKVYYEKLNADWSDFTINKKKWWAIAKQINGDTQSSIPTLVRNDISIRDPAGKARLFNEYFIAQTKLAGAESTPPDIEPFQTSKYFSDIVATYEEVFILMKNVDKSKACGHEGVGNKIISICCGGFHRFFTNFINLSFKLGKFPYQWKLANVIPIFKKENRQHKVNYRPVSLLPSFSKICEKIVFTRLYDFLLDIGFLYKYQSGFRPGDSIINQLIYITHQIYLAFEAGKEVRVVFLYISKAFNRVWHAGLLRKLKALGVRNPLLMWIESYLKGRKQRAIIEGQSSDWAAIEAGVPQGSVLGPLLFLIYINDITADLDSNPFIYADDTLVFEIVDDVDVSAENINDDLKRISVWSKKWLVSMNPSKCRTMVFSLKHDKPVHPPLFLDNVCIEEVEKYTHLGLVFQNNMLWWSHIQNIIEKVSKRLNMLKLLKYKVNRSTLTCLYKSMIRPLMEYGDVVWNNCSEGEANLLEHIQYESAKVVTGAIKGTSARALMNELAWENLGDRRKIHKLTCFFKIIKRISPLYLFELLPNTVGQRVDRALRSCDNLSSILCRTVRFRQSFFPSTIDLWNSLGADVRNSDSIDSFKVTVRSMFFPSMYNNIFDVSLNRRASILHARLRLGFHGLNEYLFKINCLSSPLCHCGLGNESVRHYFLHCPRFAAQRNLFLASAVRICGQSWSESGDGMKIFYILNGIEHLSYSDNCNFFREVHKYILSTNRFSPTCHV